MTQSNQSKRFGATEAVWGESLVECLREQVKMKHCKKLDQQKCNQNAFLRESAGLHSPILCKVCVSVELWLIPEYIPQHYQRTSEDSCVFGDINMAKKRVEKTLNLTPNTPPEQACVHQDQPSRNPCWI